MSDAFDDLMESNGFSSDLFDSQAEGGVISAEEADDHTVLHLLEALVQVSGYLSAEAFVIDYAHEHGAEVADEIAYMMTVGTHDFFTAAKLAVGGPIVLGSPEDILFYGWIRRAGGLLTQALQAWLFGKGIPVYYSFTWLSGHGFYPFILHARPHLDVDESWKRDHV